MNAAQLILGTLGLIFLILCLSVPYCIFQIYREAGIIRRLLERIDLTTRIER